MSANEEIPEEVELDTKWGKIWIVKKKKDITRTEFTQEEFEKFKKAMKIFDGKITDLMKKQGVKLELKKKRKEEGNE